MTGNRIGTSATRFHWRGYAECRQDNESCIKVMFTVSEAPQHGKQLLVQATVTGSCYGHEGETAALPNRRQLRGERRNQAVKNIKASNTTASEYHYRISSEMTDEELTSGNTTRCQEPSIFRKALSEQEKNKRLHADPIEELDLQRKVLAACDIGQHFNGYIQSVGKFPFHVSCFTERQLQFYKECVAKEETILHFDATGQCNCNITFLCNCFSISFLDFAIIIPF